MKFKLFFAYLHALRFKRIVPLIAFTNILTIAKKKNICFNFIMRILMDLGILLHLEGNKILGSDYIDFFRLSTSSGCRLYIHPALREKYMQTGHIDLNTKGILADKIQKYEILADPAPLTKEFLELLGIKKNEETPAMLQILQVYKGYVDIFVTEDHSLLSLAKQMGHSNKVLNMKDGAAFLRKTFEYKAPRHPILDHSPMRKIEHVFKDTFFDSLRKDYTNFDKWINKCLIENRKCYYLNVENNIAAILIYNLETADQHKLPGIYEKACKMCTFKTSEDAFGLKLGELFLSKMLQLCIDKNINYLYLTLYDKYILLRGLLKRFGFKEISPTKPGGEFIMVKELNGSELEKEKLNKRSGHPFYSDAPIHKKFVVPIQPRYYNTLFKDSSLRQRELFDKEKESLQEIQGNSIMKAYICNAKSKKPKPGDILFFYSSHKLKAIQPIGILDKYETSVDSLEKLIARVRGKTVFSEEELKHIFLESSQKVTILIFRLLYYMNRPIELKTIRTLKCWANKFITITEIPENDYLQLKNKEFFNERYIIN